MRGQLPPTSSRPAGIVGFAIGVTQEDNAAASPAAVERPEATPRVLMPRWWLAVGDAPNECAVRPDDGVERLERGGGSEVQRDRPGAVRRVRNETIADFNRAYRGLD